MLGGEAGGDQAAHHGGADPGPPRGLGDRRGGPVAQDFQYPAARPVSAASAAAIRPKPRRPPSVIAQTRRGAGGSSAASLRIAMRSTMPGGASVYAATRSIKRRSSAGSGGVGNHLGDRLQPLRRHSIALAFPHDPDQLARAQTDPDELPGLGRRLSVGHAIIERRRQRQRQQHPHPVARLRWRFCERRRSWQGNRPSATLARGSAGRKWSD